MKKILLVTSLIMMSVTLFAGGLEIGPSFTLKFPMSLSADQSEFQGIGPEDIKVGADVELGLGILQLGALLDFKPGAESNGQSAPASIEALVTGGVLLDLAIIRAGVGVGPTLTYDLNKKKEPMEENKDEEGSLGMGLGVKANADLVIGSFIIRLNVISSLDMLRASTGDETLEYMDVKVGLSTLFSL